VKIERAQRLVNFKTPFNPFVRDEVKKGKSILFRSNSEQCEG
jgi:hypothetical protein